MVVYVVTALRAALAAVTLGQFNISLPTPYLMMDPRYDKAEYDYQIMNMSGYITKVLFDATYNNGEFPGTSVAYTVQQGLPEGKVTQQASDSEFLNGVRNMNVTADNGCDPTLMACTYNPCSVTEMNYVSASAVDAAVGKNRHFVVKSSDPPFADVQLYGWSMCDPMFGYTDPAHNEFLFPSNVLEYSDKGNNNARLEMPNAILKVVNTYPTWVYTTPFDWESASKKGKSFACSDRHVPPYSGNGPNLTDLGWVGVMPFTSKSANAQYQSPLDIGLFQDSLANVIAKDTPGGLDVHTDTFAQLHRCVALKTFVKNNFDLDGTAPPPTNYFPPTIPGCNNTMSTARTNATGNQFGYNNISAPWGQDKVGDRKTTYGYFDGVHVAYNSEGANSNSRSTALWTDGTLNRSRMVNVGYVYVDGTATKYGLLFNDTMRINISAQVDPTDIIKSCLYDLMLNESTAHYAVYYRGGSTVAPNASYSKTVGWKQMNVLKMFNRSTNNHYSVSEWDLWSVNRLKETGLREMPDDKSNLIFQPSPGYCVMTRCMAMNTDKTTANVRLPERNFPSGEAAACYARFGMKQKLHTGDLNWLDGSQPYESSKYAIREQCTLMQFSTSVDVPPSYLTARGEELFAKSTVGDISSSYDDSHWTAGYNTDEYIGTASTSAHIGCNTQVLAVADNHENMDYSIHRSFLNTSTDAPVAITVLGSVTRGCKIGSVKNIKNNQAIWKRHGRQPAAGSQLQWEHELDYTLSEYAYQLDDLPNKWARDNFPVKAKWGQEAWLSDHPTNTTSTDTWYTPYNPFYDATNYTNYQCPIGIKAKGGALLHEIQLDSLMNHPHRYIMDIMCKNPPGGKKSDPASVTELDAFHKAYQLLYSVQDVENCDETMDAEAIKPGASVFEDPKRTLSGATISMMMFHADIQVDGVTCDQTFCKQNYPHTYGTRKNFSLIYSTYEDYTINVPEPIYDSVCPVFGRSGGPCAWLPEAPIYELGLSPTKPVCCDARNVDYNSGLCVTGKSHTSFRSGLQYNNAVDTKDHTFEDALQTQFDVTGAKSVYEDIQSKPLARPNKTAVPPASAQTPCDCGSTQPAYYCYSMPWYEAIAETGGYMIAKQIKGRFFDKEPPSSSVLKWCGFGWKDMININTPAIGLYIQSRGRPITVYDRDVLNETDIMHNKQNNTGWTYADGIQQILFDRTAPTQEVLEPLKFTSDSANGFKYLFPHGCIRWPYGQVSQFELTNDLRDVYFPEHLRAASARATNTILTKALC